MAKSKIGDSIGGRLGLLVGMAFVALFLVIAGWLYVFAQLRVGGPVYQKLSDSSVLSNDAEPPALFVVEAYLALSQAAAATDPDSVARLKGVAAEQRQAFEDRYKFWQGASLDPSIRGLLNGPVHDGAEKVFAIAERDFFPALEKGDRPGAGSAFQRLTEAYERHHAAVVELIKLIDAEHLAIEANAAASASSMEIMVGVVVAVSVAAIGFCGWAVRRSILVPLENIEASVMRLGAGETSDAVPEQGRSDELGPLARALEGWRGALLAEASSRRAEHEKSALAIKQKEAAERRVGEFRGAVNGLLHSVGRAAARMESTAGSLKNNAANGRVLAADVTSASQRAASSVQTVAAAAEQLSATVREVTGQARSAADTSTKAVKKTESLRGIVAQMAEASSRISGVIGLINDIANKTNLLALNATIEAAGAGEAGKGFAVVANEVKMLASQTAAATGDIRSQVAAVQGAAREASAAIAEIADAISDVDMFAGAISAAVVEQGQATDEIARSIVVASQGSDQLAASVADVHASTENTAGSADEVGAVAVELARLSETLNQSIESFLSDMDRAA
jgi:methyl-accepting chemotaxis protein